MDERRLPTPETARGVLGGDDGFARALERWAADAVVDEAALGRTRQRWLRAQAEEDATLVGALLDLAERGRPVSLELVAHRVRGRIVGIGGDFVALRSDRGQHVLARTELVDVVRAEAGSAAVTGDRTAVVEAGLAGVLGPLAAERPDVLVRTRSGAVVRGELRSAGVDVVHLRLPGDPPTPAWLPIDALAVVVLDP